MKGCLKCRGENLKKEFYEAEYITASEMGRPNGAKGAEIGGGCLLICQDCGAMMDRTERVESRREKKRRLWIAILPPVIHVPWKNGKGSDPTLIEKSGIITDQWGNYLGEFPLDPVKDVTKWLEEMDTCAALI